MLKTILIIMVKSFITKMVQNDYCCGVGHVVGISTLSPPQNSNHKYNLSTITFFGNLWTSHLGLFLFVLSIFD